MAKKSFKGSGLKISAKKSKGAYATKESIVKKLNERIASVVRHSGVGNEEYNRWASKLLRPRSPYATKTNTYDPSKVQLKKNRGSAGPSEKVDFVQLSRKKADIENMSLEDLVRLEKQTRGWGAVKAEAKKALEDQRKRAAAYNPFTDETDEIEAVTDMDISDYINQKEVVRQFIESNTDAFYALIEATGWDDITEHTTDEIYREVQKLDMSTYEFNNTLTEVGQDYIRRREASREHRRALGIL